VVGGVSTEGRHGTLRACATEMGVAYRESSGGRVVLEGSRAAPGGPIDNQSAGYHPAPQGAAWRIGSSWWSGGWWWDVCRLNVDTAR